MLLLLGCFSCVRLSATPEMAAHQAPHPWHSPGKNTGVGCHFLPQCMEVKSESEVAQSCTTLSDPMDCSLSGSSIHGICQARVLEWGALAFFSLDEPFFLEEKFAKDLSKDNVPQIFCLLFSVMRIHCCLKKRVIDLFVFRFFTFH